MISHVLSGGPLTVQRIVGAVREVFAVKLTRREIRRTCFETAELKRGGSGAFYIDHELTTERLVRELMAA